jgi:predicted nucleic acid-binding protein
MRTTFAATLFYLALMNPRDAAHPRAVAASEGLSGRLVTPAYVLTEVADAFAARCDRPRFLALLQTLEADPGATETLTGDHHFQQAGFIALLVED